MPSFFHHICSSFSILLFVLIFPSVATATGDTAFQVVALELEQEMVSVEARYQLKWDQLQRAIQTNKVAMLELSKGQLAAEEAVVVLAEKIRLGEEKQALSEAFAIDIAHIRYRKGIEVIKILYEKVLGLDHHFTSLKTHQSIQRLSNPNAYPDFQNSGELLKERLYKKSSVTMPSFLQSNNYVSAVYSLVSGFFGDGKSSERQSELDDVSCILDFTLKMGNDLNTIYYETKFLINNNNDLRSDCIQLFDDFVDVIDYTTSLEKCREEDDWEAVDEALEKFIEGLKSAQDSGDERLIRTVVNKGHIDMEFAIDRLLGYLDKYAAFINQGENYYKKFAVVVDSYDNEAACASKLPIQFSSLKDEIRFSIEKFIQAYDIAELKGSKLKDLLYGYE
ncbi:hypothetical protein CEQ90_12050 [Lewinellaceae bacterium SD302]|nr:hypothetical protein CEQ90_12050 [Lewinellaceae bacterium SD302]